jgi:hypothetical protein
LCILLYDHICVIYAITHLCFTIFHLGRYYLVDSGYPNQDGYLSPYTGTKYHLPEFRLAGPPTGKKEIFNHAHSSLRNAIERTFGVLKQKWRILRGVPSYPLEKQT